MIDGKGDIGVIDSDDKAGDYYVNGGSVDTQQFVDNTPNSRGFEDAEISLLKSTLQGQPGIVIVGTHNPVIEGDGNLHSYFLREHVRQITPRSFRVEMIKHLMMNARLQYYYQTHLTDPAIINRDGGGTLSIQIKSDQKEINGWQLNRQPYFAIGDGDNFLDYGIMRKNKFDFLKLCNGVGVQKRVSMVLSGHIHINWECRTKYDQQANRFEFYTDFYTQNPTKYYVNGNIDVDTTKRFYASHASDHPVTNFEVNVTDSAGIDDPVKNSNGVLSRNTPSNPWSLDKVNEDEKKLWWDLRAPLFIQTEPLGPMNNQRGNGLHNPVFNGCRLITIKDDVITQVKYVTRIQISEELGIGTTVPINGTL